MDAKRGFIPEDERTFFAGSDKKMRLASQHIFYLINEGYDLKQAPGYVGKRISDALTRGDETPNILLTFILRFSILSFVAGTAITE